MANRIAHLADFTICSELLDYHEWMCDALLDGALAKTCTLVFPDSISECPNCALDPKTGRSTNIYKAGGPYPFTNYSTCLQCGGRGRLSLPNTESVSLRVYTDSKSWIDMGTVRNSLEHPNWKAQIIGYMVDMSRVQRATHIIVNSDLEDSHRWRCQIASEPMFHGFRADRYFIQFVKSV